MADTAVLDAIADRLALRLVTTAGQPASHDHVADVVDAAARLLADAPLQQFVPLLVENAARGTLYNEGLHLMSAQGGL
jgi:hypothetical protein